ncbi:MAG: hypothetical protein AVDCRST_MAG38-779 [uncultured Solirubrobacteraceae bacterium]|uniref:Glycosyl transferase family 28 C-terminal domain-containing protein n=1 Tax=uncultured Solirubrobacteraceae bacterium TaxID=1162706 RepID=A0A6J4R7U4_9ACTN|nr:MAG: hypothetical protein AVDCRST_MAG38-779 [uncultured Solirubrobacteraceae bacterium]
MIFVTVGTHQDGFPRFLAAVETLEGSDLVVQHGPGPAPRNASVAEAFMPFPRIMEYFRAADRVVMHAGVGSVLLAVRCGHVPVIVPRLHRLGEHVDDHQSDLARGLEASGRARVAWDTADLQAVLSETPARAAAVDLPQTGLHSAVRSLLLASARQR